MGEQDYTRSEWNLAKATQERYDNLLKLMNGHSLEVKSGNYKTNLNALHCVLEEMWDEWRVRIRSKKKKEDMDNKFNETKELIAKYITGKITQSEFNTLYTKMIKLKRDLMMIKKLIGFEMPDEDQEEDETEIKEKDGAYRDL